MTEGAYQEMIAFDIEAPGQLWHEWAGHVENPYCPTCSDRFKVLLMYLEGDFYWCSGCSRKYMRCYVDNQFVGVKGVGRMPAHRYVDRSDLTDPEGNFAIIRPNSQTGHSPSTRYKTAAKATEAAKRLCLSTDQPQTFEVVRIVKRVTTTNQVRVINVR
jgi:hypothetical protein